MADSEKELRPCCACRETRDKRDQCVLLNGEEKCSSEIVKHLECLRSKGFTI